MREWGWTNPVLIDEKGMIISGHGRILAAQQLGMTEAPVMVARGWTDQQKRAFVIADNKITDNAGWNPELLKGELNALEGEGFDVSLMAFTADELGAIRADDGPHNVREIQTSEVDDRFWISISGNLEGQAKVLDRVKQVLDEFPEIKIEMGVISLAI